MRTDEKRVLLVMVDEKGTMVSINMREVPPDSTRLEYVFRPDVVVMEISGLFRQLAIDMEATRHLERVHYLAEAELEKQRENLNGKAPF